MSWHDDSDKRWDSMLSANEFVLASDDPDDLPVVSAKRAVELLVDLYGQQRLAELVWYGTSDGAAV